MKIEEDKFIPDFVVIYPSEEGFNKNLELAFLLKTHLNSKIIFVGPWVSLIPHDSKYVDNYILGEFEFAVKEIVEGGNFNKVHNAGRLNQSEVDDLPWVSKTYLKHLDIRKYHIGSLFSPFVDMFVEGRKCYWGKCSFCLYPNTIFNDETKGVRKLDDVLDELEWVSTQHKTPYCIKPVKIKEVFFQDDTPTPERLKQIAQGIIDRGIKIAWSTYARGDGGFTKDDLKLLKQSGLHCFHVGFESGNDKILKAMNKGVTKKSLTKFAKKCWEVGIDVHGDFLFGTSELETEETIKDTIKWAKTLNLSTFQISSPRVYKNTSMYYDLKTKGYLDEHGRVNYPHLSYDRIEYWCKRALREYYFRWGYIKTIIFKPREVFRVLKSFVPVMKYILTKQHQVVE